MSSDCQYTTRWSSWLLLRAVPEIIPGGVGWIFFQTPPPPGQTSSQSPPRPPGHVSALINLPHYGSNMPWPPGQVIPHPSDMSTKHSPLAGQKSACSSPLQDNFWNSPKAPSTPWLVNLCSNCSIIIFLLQDPSFHVSVLWAVGDLKEVVTEETRDKLQVFYW